MTEEDPEVVAMRERAEQVMARRAKERAEVKRASDEDAPPEKKTGRRWYNWVIDGLLFGVAAYMIYTRFLQKKPEPPPATPPTSVSASASPIDAAQASVVTRATTEVLEAPAPSSKIIETLPEKTRVEVLQLSPSGYLEVKTPSGKVGWVAASSVATQP